MGDVTKGGVLFQHPRGLPGKTKWGGYVYVLLFRDGLVKVGFTAQPAKRIESHRAQSEGYGNPMVKGWLSPWHDNGQANEKELIEYAERWATSTIKNEYFVGVAFERLVTFARKLPFAPVDVDAHEVAWEARMNDHVFHAELEAAKERLRQLESQSPLERMREYIGSWFGRQPTGEYIMDEPEVTSWSMEAVDRVAAARRCTTNEVLDMNRIDLQQAILIEAVRAEAAHAYAHAARNGKLGWTRTIGEELAEMVGPGQ